MHRNSMDRRVRDRLEDILAGVGGNAVKHVSEAKGLEAVCHLDDCADCRQTLTAMRDQQRMLRSLRAPEDIEPKGGFYARVIERIESQGVASIWSLFFESAIGRGVAMASVVLVLSAGVYLVSTEREAEAGQALALPALTLSNPGTNAAGMFVGAPDRDAVLMNLVTYREQ
jgi:predicted anti-sigma-YlaC factor YlaD